MSAEQNKALVRRFCEELWNQGKVEVIDELFAPDRINHENPRQLPDEGRRRLRQIIGAYRAAFPDVRMTVEDQIAEGDRVVSRWVITGTQNGPFRGIPASGKRINVTGIWIDRFAGGKIVESWENWDALELYRQLGVLALRVG